MSTSLTATREDYLRAIRRIKEEQKIVGITDIAKYLKLSKSTVSERLQELMQAGLVKKSAYPPIVLTERGNRAADLITHKHRIIEVFLHKTLKIPSGKVHKEAHRLEHAMSDDVIKRLARFLKNPKYDPHGRRIPKYSS